MIGNNQIQTLMLLHGLEKALSDMYAVLLQAYPEHSTLWNRLMSEEKMHAEAVRKLYGLTYQGKVLFDDGTIRHDEIKSITENIKNISDSARKRKYTAIEILSNSLEIEKSLVERKLFSHFQVSPEFANLLRTLQQGSESHGSLVEMELAKFTNRANPKSKTRQQ